MSDEKHNRIEPAVLIDLSEHGGADDPLTFATCLADERAYALAGAMAQGMTLPEAARWIEERRLEAEKASFRRTALALSSSAP